MRLKTDLENHAIDIEELETASNLAWWNLAVTGDDKYAHELQKYKMAIRRIYSSEADYETLLSHPLDEDPLVNRQLLLVLNQYKENQIPVEWIEKMTALETEIESLYTNFRPIIDGKPTSNNDLKKILVDSTDVFVRKKAWEASKEIGRQVEGKVKQLIALRNEGAVKAGFKNYYSMRLVLQELEEKRLFDILDEVERLTDPIWKTYKEQLDQVLANRFNCSVDDLQPWHYQDPFFQEAPRQDFNLDPYYQGKDIAAISQAFYQAIGLDVEDVLQRSDLYERENKNQHAFCINIDRQQDIRILCNLRDNEYWMGTQLHELGHAVYEKFIDPHLPYFLRTYAHINTTEASAQLFGRLSKHEQFLNFYVGVEAETARSIATQARQLSSANLLVFARWTLVMVNFERAMYQQPDRDLNAFWWECVERYQGIKRVPQRNQPDWAAKLHLACAPVYYQNYLLGEMTASQLIHHIERLVKAQREELCSSKHFGNFLKTRLYSLGARYPWEETLRHAIGEGLNPQAFVTDVSHI
jgi:peptidyl-dipeptidase A